MKKPIGYIVQVTTGSQIFMACLSLMASRDEKGVLFFGGYSGVTMFKTRDAARRAIQKSRAFYKELTGRYDIFPVFRGEAP